MRKAHAHGEEMGTFSFVGIRIEKETCRPTGAPVPAPAQIPGCGPLGQMRYPGPGPSPMLQPTGPVPRRRDTTRFTDGVRGEVKRRTIWLARPFDAGPERVQMHMLRNCSGRGDAMIFGCFLLDSVFDVYTGVWYV